MMGSHKYVDTKVVDELNRAFEERGALYSLYYFVGAEDSDPKLYKKNKEVKYKL